MTRHRRSVWEMLSGLSLTGLSLVLMAPSLQADTLADVKRDLATYAQDIAQLRSELSLSDTGSGENAAGTSAVPLERVIAIETALQRMTAKVEELEHRVGTVSQDGAYRIRDLQWRLCELDADCDTADLAQLPEPLGGATASAQLPTVSAPSVPVSEGAQLAAREKADFDLAQAALDRAAYAEAARLFATYLDTYPAGPLFATALVGEGRALAGTGDTREAARRYLRAYADYPDDVAAPEALWRLGDVLAELGDVTAACVTLAEVDQRYPNRNTWRRHRPAATGWPASDTDGRIVFCNPRRRAGCAIQRGDGPVDRPRFSTGNRSGGIGRRGFHGHADPCP